MNATEKLRDRYRGCLLAGAAGDALGYPIEFITEKEIYEQCGTEGVTEFDADALISDDTQMTLFTAWGLCGSDAKTAREKVYQAYLLWLQTQEEPYSDKFLKHPCPLMHVRELFSRRAPGITCLHALSSGLAGSVIAPLNDSKGCGGVMRTAPAGLYLPDIGCTEKETATVGAELAALTHGHSLGYIPSAMFSLMIHLAAHTDKPFRSITAEALAVTAELYANDPNMPLFQKLITAASRLPDNEMPDQVAIHMLGAGWVAEEALAVAVYCAIKYENDVERALITSVNHSGDSDSTGSITGNLIGARVGLSGIPEKFRRPECAETILKTADLLFDCSHGNSGAP